jgi:molybdenum cofactor biosynthesis protein B
MSSPDRDFIPLRFAVLTVSDTRDLASDSSGGLLEQELGAAGHVCHERIVVKDEVEAIRAKVQSWCATEGVQVILVTGGTGVTARDVTPEALEPLYDKALSGFGELFRMLSWEDIGAATIQSRASAGVIDGRLVFVLPGSTGACRLAVEKILLSQLDARTRPCSFAGLIDRL